MYSLNPLKNKWTAWILWGLWCAMILKFSSDPATVSSGKSGWLLAQILGLFRWAGAEPGNLDFLHYLIRKTAHFMNYLCLGLVTYNALRLTTGKYKQLLFVAAFMMTAGFAGIDEYFQTFIPGRSGQLKDVLIDSAGAALGLLVLWSSSLQSEESEAFLRYRIQKNLYFGKIIVGLLLVFECLFIGIALWSFKNANRAAFHYGAYLCMYLIMIGVSGVAYVWILRFKPEASDKKTLQKFDQYFDLYNIFVVLWGAGITLMDQTLYASMNAYFINLVIVTTLFQHTRVSLDRLFRISVIVVSVLMPFFQPSIDVLIGHYVNGGVFITIYWFASHFLHKTFIAHYEAQSNLEEAVKQLEIIAEEDLLTGLPNRRGMERFIKQLESLKVVEETWLGVLIIDIDHFKQYNDDLGHVSGDEALKQVATVLKHQQSSMNDFVLRYGGEEFVFLSIHTDSETFKEKAETIRQEVEKLAISHPASQVSSHVTISIGGINEPLPFVRSLKEIFKEADSALYEAKASGRNQVVFFSL